MERLHHQPPSCQPWRALAKAAGFPISALNPTDRETLDLLERVLIRGKGWGPRDPLRGHHRQIELRTELLARRAARGDRPRSSPRTWRKARARLESFGLLNCQHRPGRASVVRPSWWRHPDELLHTIDPLTVWRGAAAVVGAMIVTGNLAAYVPGRVPGRVPGPVSSNPKPEKAITPVSEETERTGGTGGFNLPSEDLSVGRARARPSVSASPIQRKPRKRRARKRTRGRLPIRDPEIRQATFDLLYQAPQFWPVVRGSLADGYPADIVLAVLRESLAPGIQNPVAYFRATLPKRTPEPDAARERRQRYFQTEEERRDALQRRCQEAARMLDLEAIGKAPPRDDWPVEIREEAARIEHQRAERAAEAARMYGKPPTRWKTVRELLEEGAAEAQQERESERN